MGAKRPKSLVQLNLIRLRSSWIPRMIRTYGSMTEYWLMGPAEFYGIFFRNYSRNLPRNSSVLVLPNHGILFSRKYLRTLEFWQKLDGIQRNTRNQKCFSEILWHEFSQYRFLFWRNNLNPNILTPYIRKVGGSKKDNGVSTLKPPSYYTRHQWAGEQSPKNQRHGWIYWIKHERNKD